MSLPACIVTDIEGTVTRVAFVHDVLFPYARARLAEFLSTHAARADVVSALNEARRLAPGADPLGTLLGWMDADAKVGPLKVLQGLIWAQGYADGTLKGELYPDVAPALRHWHAAGVRLYVYSSGSVAAQKMLFRCSVAGNLEGLFSGFFDTGVGAKRESASYAAIARAVEAAAGQILFLSDVAEELDAAAAVGLRTCQLVRAEDRTIASGAHAQAADFTSVEGPLTRGKIGGDVPSPPKPPVDCLNSPN